MESDRKRKLDDVEESPQNIMTSLLKRLHLEKTSELYEKVPLFERKPPTLKRWRLSPIQEHEESLVKRRKLDSEMADQMFNALWISENKDKDIIPASKQHTTPSETEPDTDPVMLSENIQSIDVNIPLHSPKPSLEESFIQRQLREQNMQVALWTPPLILDTIRDTRYNISSNGEQGGSFQNEDGETEYMC